MVGSRFIDLNRDDFEIHSPDLYQVNLLKTEAVLAEVELINPDLVINFAAFTDVDKAEAEKGDKEGLSYRLNVIAARDLAQICHKLNKKLVHFSTDYVFDGKKSDSPYQETDTPNPINWYGETKYLGEQEVLSSGCESLIIRISMPYSSFYQEKTDVARFFLARLKDREEVRAVSDQKVTPVFVDETSQALVKLIAAESVGIYHIVSSDWTTPYQFVRDMAAQFKLDDSLIKPINFDQFYGSKSAKRLKNSWLDSTKFQAEYGGEILHSIKQALELFYSQTLLLGSK